MDTKIRFKHIIWAVGLFVFIIFIGSLLGSDSSKESQTSNIQTSTIVSPEIQTIKLTSEQKEIKSFLTEIGNLTIKSGEGNDNIYKAGIEMESDGVPLPYVVSAQISFESILENANRIQVPLGGENVKKYFIESIQYILKGTKLIREGLEVFPVNKSKLQQGVEVYNKSMLSMARSAEEVNKLKLKFNLTNVLMNLK